MKALIFAVLLILNKAYGLNYLNPTASGIKPFHVSEKWPQCKDTFEDIQVQGNCSSSWAISVATSIRDRRCIKSGVKDPISAYDPISCCSDCQLDGKNGCNGGDHSSAFHYFNQQGIVTGGAFRTYEGCKPYPIRPNPKSDAPKSTECVKACDSSYKTTSYENDKVRGVNTIVFSFSNQHVMDEIQKNGPMVAEFELYDDFLNYTGGVYQHKTGKLHGYYYAKILGWGQDETGLGFWTAAASFGSNWGENGTFRIAMRQNNCGFESSIIGAVVRDAPDVKRTKTQAITTTKPRKTTTISLEPHDITCQKITAYYSGTFQYPPDRSKTFQGQLEFSVDLNLHDGKFYSKINRFNREYRWGYHFDIWNGTNIVFCDTDQNDNCPSPFYYSSMFRLDFVQLESPYWSNLLLFNPPLSDTFTLQNAIGHCGTTLKNNDHSMTDPNLYKRCFCCGDTYNPHPFLGCPVTPWS